MEWILNKTNEENKLLLARLNTKNYELSCKKMEQEHLFGEVKRFLLSIISLLNQENEEDDNDNGVTDDKTSEVHGDDDGQEEILQRLMRITKKKLTKFSKQKAKTAVGDEKKSANNKNTSTHVSRSSQTSIVCMATSTGSPVHHQDQMHHTPHHYPQRTPEIVKNLYNNISYPHHHVNQSPYLQSPRASNLDDIMTSNHQQSTAKKHQYQKAFDDYNSLFTNEFLGYVEFIKNKEITSYKDVGVFGA